MLSFASIKEFSKNVEIRAIIIGKWRLLNPSKKYLIYSNKNYPEDENT